MTTENKLIEPKESRISKAYVNISSPSRDRKDSAHYEADVEEEDYYSHEEADSYDPKKKETQKNGLARKIDVSLSTKKAVLVCPFPGCYKSFKKEAHLKQHESVHTGERTYVCQYPECQKGFTRPYHLKRHQAVHNNDERKTFQCMVPNCTVTCSSAYGLKKHVIRKHEGPLKGLVTDLQAHICTKPLRCDHPGCPQTFQSQKYLHAHQREHQNEEYPHKCSVEKCGKSFQFLSKLKKHMEKHKGYLCEKDGCGKVCSTFGEMRTHFKVAHTVIECQTCGKTFSSRSSLKQHMVTHLDAKDRVYVPCSYEGCSKSFANEPNMKTHFFLAHANAEKLKCTIEGCAQTFVNKHTLDRHLKNHEAIELQHKRRLKNRKKKMKKKRKQTRIVTSSLSKISGFPSNLSEYMISETCSESETDQNELVTCGAKERDYNHIEDEANASEFRSPDSELSKRLLSVSDPGILVLDSDILNSSESEFHSENEFPVKGIIAARKES